MFLPALALGLGFVADQLHRWLSEKFQEKIALLVVLGACVTFFGPIIYPSLTYYFRAPPEFVIHSIYRGNPFVEAQAIADYLQKHTTPDSRIAIFGSEPEIAFYAHRRLATGYVYMYDAVADQKYARTMQEQIIREVEAAQPEFIVDVNNQYSWLAGPMTHEALLLQWMDRFRREKYEREAVILPSLDHETVYLWNKAAVEAAGTPDLAITIWKRKQS